MSARSDTTRSAMNAFDTRGIRPATWAVAAVAAIAAWLAAAAPVLAAPRWRLESISDTTVAAGGTLEYYTQARNIGDASMDGSRIDIVVTLPRGLTAVRARLVEPARGFFSCFDASDGVSAVPGATSVVCPSTSRLPSMSAAGDDSVLKAEVTAVADVGVSGLLEMEAAVSGGGAAAARTIDPTIVSRSPPGFGFDAFDGQVAADVAGTPFTQAGGHPYDATVSMDFNTITDEDPFHGALWPVESTRNVIVDLPPGLVGNPSVADRCTASELAGTGGLGGTTFCPASSQVGVVYLRMRAGGDTTPIVFGPYSVFNLVPPGDVPARFGFNAFGAVITLDGELRSGGDYGLSVNARNVPQALAIAGTTFTFWGVPASSDHDSERGCAGEFIPLSGGPTCRTNLPLRPFLRLPTSCTAPGVGLPVTARIDSWENPGVFRSATWFSHEPPAYPFPPSRWGPQVGPEGCDRVPFRPVLDARPASRVAGAPAAFTFDLSMPQTDDPTLIGHADLRRAVVTLPLGVRVSPSSANGLGACAPSEIGIRNGEPPACPDSAKIGTVTIETPLLPDPLDGHVYLAKPNDNPFGSLLAVYLVAEGPGVVVKLPGRVEAHPVSGQLTATFDDNPQLPFSNLHLEFKGGSRAPLVLPEVCGTYTTHALMTGWNGASVVSESSFTVDQGCAGGFTPGFSAGTTNPVAGASSTFALRMTRDDADQELRSVTVDMPAGLTGRIADAVLCDAAAGAAGKCGPGSLIGNVTVGAGAGANPFYITNGRVHITKGYGGAPFGLSIVVPAVAGPFNLGEVVVRSQIFVDRHTAELRVVSEPFPTILEGIPLDVRDVRVTIDRDGFFLNPTSCEEKTVSGVIGSTAGSSAAVSTRFQVGDCASLPLRPGLVVRVGGRRRTQKGRSTPLKTRLRMPDDGANLRQVRVTLPTVLNARLTVINDACTRAEYDSGSDVCEFARTGSAVAVTPLLRDPLRGGVYFVRNGNPLPDLFVRLRGQVDFDLVGKITIPGSKRLRTTFDLVPDVPVSKFALRLDGGRDGSVGNAANLCRPRSRRARVELDFVGQNGKVLQVDRRLRIKGCKSKRRAASRKRSTGGGRRGR